MTLRPGAELRFDYATGILSDNTKLENYGGQGRWLNTTGVMLDNATLRLLGNRDIEVTETVLPPDDVAPRVALVFKKSRRFTWTSASYFSLITSAPARRYAPVPYTSQLSGEKSLRGSCPIGCTSFASVCCWNWWPEPIHSCSSDRA